MCENITIRSAISTDVHALVDIKTDACLLFGEQYKSDIPFTHSEFESFQENGNLFVATDKNDAPCGYSGSYKIEEDFFLYHLFVARKYSGKKIGLRLLKHLENRAREERRRSVTLITSSSAPWNGPFYEHQGYVYLDEKDMPLYLREKWISSRDYFSPENPIVALCPMIVPRVAMEKRLG